MSYATLVRKESHASASRDKPTATAASYHATRSTTSLVAAEFPTKEQQRAKVPRPNCHDQNKDRGEFDSSIPEEFKKWTMIDEQMREWLKQTK